MKKIREIEKRNAGVKWEIYKISEKEYGYKYLEYINFEWRVLFEESGYTKDAIEFEFGIKIA